MTDTMDKEKIILEEVDKTLTAFDNLPKLEANPFLYTRIQARIASDNITREKYQFGGLKLKFITLSIIFILNIITAIYFFESDKKDYTKDQLIRSLQKEYNVMQSDY
jgi:hypothetical protein